MKLWIKAVALVAVTTLAACGGGPTRRVVTSPLTTPVRRMGSRSNEPQTLRISYVSLCARGFSQEEQ